MGRDIEELVSPGVLRDARLRCLVQTAEREG